MPLNNCQTPAVPLSPAHSTLQQLGLREFPGLMRLAENLHHLGWPFPQLGVGSAGLWL